VDKVRHPRPDKFDQAVNLIVFVNPDWLPEYGGHLELWASDASHKSVSIEPLFNRLVLFQSDRRTFHGHPEPLQCPEELFRTSIAAYYYVPRNLKVPPFEPNDIGWRR
jgi:Rps23 Pro-64 3,4-dihydroxylase Tpa1-like proline 4-hydroxylase